MATSNVSAFIPPGAVYVDRQGVMRQNTADYWCWSCGQYFDSLWGFWRHRVMPVWPAGSSPRWRGKAYPGPLVWITTEDDARRWGLGSDLPGWWRAGWPGWPRQGNQSQGWGWGLPGWPGPNANWRSPAQGGSAAGMPPVVPPGLPRPPSPPAPPLRCLSQAEMTWWCWTTNARGGWIPPQWEQLSLQWTVTGTDFNGKAFSVTGTIPTGTPPLLQEFGDIGSQVFNYLTVSPGGYAGPFALTEMVLQLVGPAAVTGSMPVQHGGYFDRGQWRWDRGRAA